MTNTVDSPPVDDTSDRPEQPEQPVQPVQSGRRGGYVAVVVPLVLLFGIAVTLTVLAYNSAKTSNDSGHFTVFWLAMAAVLAAAVLGGVRLPDSRYALPGLLTAVGLVTYLPKFLMSVNDPAYFDEYAHLRHVQDMVATGNLGASNDLLPVVQYYPGLGTATMAVHYVTGLNLWHAGQVVIVIAHCATLVLIYALARTVDLSRRTAFLAALVYAANPGFLYFDSQYAYESLAIPLLLLTAVAAARARRATTSVSAFRNLALGVIAATATLLTHHVTSVVMAGLCVLIALFLPTRADRDAGPRPQRYSAWLIAGWAVVAAVVWNFVISTGTRSYVLPSLSNGITQLLDRLTGNSAPTNADPGGAQNAGGGAATNSQHSLFQGTGAPSYEKFFAYAVPVLILAAAVLTAIRIWRSSERRAEFRLSAPFGVLTLAYLASLPLALTTAGNQAAHRSWPFLFIGVAIFSVWTIGRTSTETSGAHRTRRNGTLVAAIATFAVLVVANIGSVAAGANVAYRFPGPYTFGEDNRFRTAELNDVVRWTKDNVPARSHIVTDRFTAQPLTVDSTMNIPTNKESFAYTLFRRPGDPSPALRTFLADKGFRYFILDRRILTTPPVQVFFQGYGGISSTNLQALRSIPNNDFISLIHSTKNYRVYRINP